LHILWRTRHVARWYFKFATSGSNLNTCKCNAAQLTCQRQQQAK
jgi:hypothetical protein